MVLLGMSACGRIYFDPRSDSAQTALPCEQQHTFCDSFDRAPQDIQLGWDGLTTFGMGTIAIDTTRSVSQPSSLGVSVAGPGNDLALMAKQLPAMTSRVHVAFDIAYSTQQAFQSAEIDLLRLDWDVLP